MQLQQVYLNFVGWQVGDWMKCMCNLSDKFVVGITFYANYCILLVREEVQIS